MIKKLRLCCLVLLLAIPAIVRAADFTVTTPDFFFNINDVQPNPTLTLTRGVTYTFDVETPGHPFWIKQSSGFGATGRFDTGVTGNGTQFGTITFSVPTNAPATLLYQCGNHGFMTGTINVVDPAPSDHPRILHDQWRGKSDAYFDSRSDLYV
jgi:hypothetical protein